MLIFYKSTSPTAPPWMKTPHQRDYKNYYVYCESMPAYWPPPDTIYEQLCADDADPTQTTDIYVHGKIEEYLPAGRDHFTLNNCTYIKTPCGSSVPVYPAMDRAGRAWTVPMIVNGSGPCLALTWRYVDGAIVREPSQQQSDIIDTVEAMRDAILSDHGLAGLPLRLAATAASLIMSYAHHAEKSEFMRYGVLDDFIVPRILMAASGLGTPEHPLDATDGETDTPILNAPTLATDIPEKTQFAESDYSHG